LGVYSESHNILCGVSCLRRAYLNYSLQNFTTAVLIQEGYTHFNKIHHIHRMF